MGTIINTELLDYECKGLSKQRVLLILKKVVNQMNENKPKISRKIVDEIITKDGTFVYHFAPQFLQCIVFLILLLNRPNITPPTTFFVTDIFSISVDPHVGHFG